MDETRYLGFFATRERAFWLPMPRVIAAEREMGVAIGQLYVDLAQNVGLIGEHPVLMSPLPARLQNCHHLIRNALIGGGETEEAAAELVSIYCYPARPAIRDFELAYRILAAAIQGVNPQKKNRAAGTPRPFDKGQVIANCGAIGLDWERLSLSGYIEALTAHNSAHDAGGTSSVEAYEPGDGLRRFHRARSRADGGNQSLASACKGRHAHSRSSRAQARSGPAII